ncbi:hypothetical protein TD95_001164 [Thielaviopsis punctulata]|uniref:Zinc finger PHD-type domain-containing protein n=1 Tax=Thielaviopsis punctulata TaxID=72032 RepID=A0A0F4ZHU4_9PEZI|nr:hypothetical protein TD95_001164 [Thielaviopsis punctulata]
MAPLSPRRSSRARIPNTHSHSSASASAFSASSTSSARPERSTRSHRPSSAKSTPSASLSSESPDDYDDIHILRSSRRRVADDDSSHSLKGRLSRRDTSDMGNNSNDEVQEDDEAVRCVCGYDDYPGPPPHDSGSSGLSKRTKDKDSSDSDFFNGIEINEDVSGFYVQCDVCKVWQHGACVGIMTEESSPDEYYCEKCRKDLHKIHTASNGQRYSHYTFATRLSRANSRTAPNSKDKDKDGALTSRSGRASSASQTAKRRSTMNSRDAAYDEEEELRRAIEASKEDAPPEFGDGTSRRPKRGRSNSEEYVKTRPEEEKDLSHAASILTSSPSGSSSAEKPEVSPDDSEDSSSTRNTKKSRQSRSQRENSEREEKERQRQEAANKRKVRADRRRAEGSSSREPEKDDAMVVETKESPKPMDEDQDETLVTAPASPIPAPADAPVAASKAPTPAPEPAATADAAVTAASTSAAVPEKTEPDEDEEMPLADAAPKPTEAAAMAEVQDHQAEAGDAPDAPQVATPAPVQSNKKSSKNSKKGRGRNQYTRDRDRDRDDTEDSPARSMRESRHKNSAHDNNYTNGGHSRSSRHDSKNHGRNGKQGPGKLSILELKRRSAAFLDFIQKTQLELAAEATPSHSNSSENSREQSHDEHAEGGRRRYKGEAQGAEERRRLGDEGDGDEKRRLGAEEAQTATGGMAVPRISVAGADAHAPAAEPRTTPREFSELSCGEMMDVLTRDLLKWQSQYLS